MSLSIEEICIDLMNENKSKDDIIDSLMQENNKLRKELEEYKEGEDDLK